MSQWYLWYDNEYSVGLMNIWSADKSRQNDHLAVPHWGQKYTEKKNKKERKPNIAQTKVLGLQPYSQEFMESVKYKFLSAVWKTVEVMVDKMG